jgi:hypothetical protein
MRDWIVIGCVALTLTMGGIVAMTADRLDRRTAERDEARAVAEGYRKRAEMDRLIAEEARAEHLLIGYRLAEIEARGPERVTVYRDRVRVIEPLPSVCGPGADRVAAVNEALR